jgi:hypothetical protein
MGTRISRFKRSSSAFTKAWTATLEGISSATNTAGAARQIRATMTRRTRDQLAFSCFNFLQINFLTSSYSATITMLRMSLVKP